MAHRRDDTFGLTVAVGHPFPIVAETLEALIRATRPEALVRDLSTADMVVATLEIAEAVGVRPDTRLVALVDRADRRSLAEARGRGAIAALPLDLPTAELSAALGVVLSGKSWFPVVAAPAEERAADRRLDSLSGQQFRVLDLMSRGRLNKQIAYDLGISEGTVKSHVSSILRKLGVERRTQAIATFITVGEPARGGPQPLSRATHAAR